MGVLVAQFAQACSSSGLVPCGAGFAGVFSV